MTFLLEAFDTRMAHRVDLEMIAAMVRPGATALDLGCGDGTLLQLLADRQGVIGTGVELSDDGVRECVSKGLPVYHGDLDEGLADYPADSFDYVILSQTLQAVHRPAYVLREMLRVGRTAIVSFPNFGHWSVRCHLLAAGRMPMTEHLPYEWYDTPNIHLLTINDFRAFCRAEGLRIEAQHFLSDGRNVHLFPNLLGRLAIFVVEYDRR